MERRLAAILAADVVGYSQAMGQDEAGTLAALSQLRRELIEPLIAQHRGRIFKLTGDGILVEFASVVDAVACAVAWQGAMAADGLQFRIGVNLGDVMHQDGDIYGNGVNVAARLEGLAEPGGICVSGIVQSEARGKLELSFEDLGERTVKNIDGPIRVWRIAKSTLPPQTEVRRAAVHDKASLAVLPFTNMSGDPEQEYFSDGITEDIITELSRFAELLVIARNSSFTFKGRAVDVKEVGRTLGVAYVVEGSVRKVGNRVRITAQLIGADNGEHVWAERYDRELKDIFDLQDEVAGTVAATVAGRVKLVALDRLRRRPTGSLSAYDNYLRCLEPLSKYETAKAEHFLVEALRIDPDFALARALLCMVQTYKYFFDGAEDHLATGLAYARQALALDPDLGWAHFAMGQVLMFHPHRLQEAGNYLDRALSLNPNNSSFRLTYGLWLCYAGQLEEAVHAMDHSFRRDPSPVDSHLDVRGIILTAAERYEEAIAAYNRMSNVPPWGLVYLAICHERLGRPAVAKTHLSQATGRLNTSVAGFLSVEQHQDPAAMERFSASLKRLGMPER